MSGGERGGVNDKELKGSTATKAVSTSMSAPDEKMWQEKIDLETKACDDLKQAINDIQRKVSANSGGRDEFNRKKADVRGRLDELQHKVDELEGERKKILTMIEERQKQGREMRTNVVNLKKTIGYSTEDDIDKKISEITHRMQTTTMSLKDEKKMMTEISQLKSNKPLVGKYANMENSANSFDDNTVAPLRSRLDQLRTDLSQCRDQRKEASERYRTLVDERAKVTAPVKELFDELDELNKKMGQHQTKRKELQDGLTAEKRNYQIYQTELKQVRMEKSREEKRKRAAEQERENIERQLEREEELPMVGELQLVQQALTYLQKLQGTDQPTVEPEDMQKAEEAAAAAAAKLEPTTQAGGKKYKQGDAEEVLLLPKNKRDEEYFFAPKKKAGAAAKKSTPSGKRSKALKYDIGTMQYFRECGVEAPNSVDDIPTCAAKLKAKLEKYKELQRLKSEESAHRRLTLLAKLDVLDGKPPRAVPPPSSTSPSSSANSSSSSSHSSVSAETDDSSGTTTTDLAPTTDATIKEEEEEKVVKVDEASPVNLPNLPNREQSPTAAAPVNSVGGGKKGETDGTVSPKASKSPSAKSPSNAAKTPSAAAAAKSPSFKKERVIPPAHGQSREEAEEEGEQTPKTNAEAADGRASEANHISTIVNNGESPTASIPGSTKASAGAETSNIHLMKEMVKEEEAKKPVVKETAENEKDNHVEEEVDKSGMSPTNETEELDESIRQPAEDVEKEAVCD